MFESTNYEADIHRDALLLAGDLLKIWVQHDTQKYATGADLSLVTLNIADYWRKVARRLYGLDEVGYDPLDVTREGKEEFLFDLLRQDMGLQGGGLSTRAMNCLDSENIRTVRDLVARKETDLLKIKQFGETSLREIKKILAARGLSLAAPDGR